MCIVRTKLLYKKSFVEVTDADMEFGTNFTRTEVFRNNFIHKYSLNYAFFSQ